MARLVPGYPDCPPKPQLTTTDGPGQEQSNPETTYPVSGQYELKWTFQNFYLNANFQSVRIIYKLLINLQQMKEF